MRAIWLGVLALAACDKDRRPAPPAPPPAPPPDAAPPRPVDAAPAAAAPRMRTGAITVDGAKPIDEQGTRAALEAFAPFLDCYREALAAEPGLAGTVVASIHQMKNGKTVDDMFESKGLTADLRTCLRWASPPLQLPATGAYFHFTVELIFEPG